MQHEIDEGGDEHWQRHSLAQGFETTLRRLQRQAAAEDGCCICKAIWAALVVFVKRPKPRALIRVGPSLFRGHILEYRPKVDDDWELSGRTYEDYIQSGSDDGYSLKGGKARNPDLDTDGDEDEDKSEDEGEEEEHGDEGGSFGDHWFNEKENVNLELYFDRASTQPPAWPALSPARTLGSSFCLEDTHLLWEWLEDCRCDHGSKCSGKYGKGASASATLPTRLLDVGVENPGEDIAADEAIRLYETSPGDQAEYVALSHCWGGEGSRRPPKTVAENLESRKTAIPMSELPPTFRDAVQLTRFLGFRYLWIDSLCIIQGDVADWERESVRMVDVYLRATLTIAADGAADCDGGLFATVARRDHKFSATEIRLRDLGIPQDGCFCVRRSGGDIYDGNWLNLNPPGEPLGTRGWTFQEWLLSPRIAHFRTGELGWECETEYRCECQEGGVSYPMMPDKSSFTPVFKGFVGYPWHNLVSTFTSRSLTVEEDRLPAVSGLVGLTLLSGQVDSRDYVAGHWRSNLVPSLLWTRSIRMTRMAKRLSKSYAPTWSWGSVGTLVHFTKGANFSGEEGQFLATVVDIRVTEISAQASRLGLVKSAEIELRGPVGTFPGPALVSEGGEVYVGKDGLIVLDVTSPLEIEVHDVSKLVFLALREQKIAQEYKLYGLALQRDGERDVFRRVGWAELSCDRGSENTWKKKELKIRKDVCITII